MSMFTESQEESDSFKGQMEARYRERTELGLVLPGEIDLENRLDHCLRLARS